MLKSLGALGVVAVVAALVYLTAIVVLQRRVMYPRPVAPAHVIRPTGTETMWLGANEDVEAWLLRPTAAVPRYPVVVFTHGNGELIDYWVEPFGYLTDRGFGVLLVEYPGYGRSGGSPTEKSISETIVAAFDTLAARGDVDAGRIVAYGRSLGGAAAVVLAAQRPVAALVLESTFTSVAALALGLGVPSFLVLDRFDNLAAVESIEAPVLVLHGERDQVIPFRHGELLAAAAATQLVPMPCGHNDCRRPWEAVLEFLARHEIIGATER